MFFYTYMLRSGMERSRGADRFADNVVHRVDTDTVLKPWLIVLSLLIPVMFGFLLAYGYLYEDDGRYFRDSIDDYLLVTLVFGLFLLECGELSFLLYIVVKRNKSHLDRDAQWMDALCLYVDEHRGDSTAMRAIAANCKGVITGPATAVSFAAWVFEVLMLVILGVLLAVTAPDGLEGYRSKAAILLPPTLIVLLAQLIITSGSAFGFPARHDKLQSEFTKELSSSASAFGLSIGPMPHIVQIRKLWPHIVLAVVTLGLYLFVYLFISCREMNRHLASQWEYEEYLLRSIISFEGGTGVEAVGQAK